jgi:hypothetical protein
MTEQWVMALVLLTTTWAAYEARCDVAYDRESNHVPEHSIISVDWRMA